MNMHITYVYYMLFYILMPCVRHRSIEKSSNNVESRVLASLLTEMDGIDGASSEVIVIAATNRMESIDAALLRKVCIYMCALIFCTLR